MLNIHQKKQLKALANSVKQKYQVGKSNVTNTVIDTLEKALDAHELIKIDVLKGCETPIMEVALDLSSKLNADVVQIIGRKIVLFRQNKENSKIKLLK